MRVVGSLAIVVACLPAAVAWGAGPVSPRAFSRVAPRSALLDIRLAAKKSRKAKASGAPPPAASRSPQQAPAPAAAAPPPPPAVEAAAEPEAAQAFSSDDFAVWDGLDEPPPAPEQVQGVLKLPTYEDWQAKRQEEDGAAGGSGSSERRRRRRAGSTTGGAPVAAAPAAPGLADRNARRLERQAAEEEAAAASAAAAAAALVASGTAEGLSAALAERDRRRQLLLLDPSADVFAGGPPPSLRKSGPLFTGAGAAGAGTQDEEYDLISALLGEGQRTEAGNFFLGPYLQSGHLILLLGSLLSAYGYSPNFPLTSLPEEYRDLVKTALLITYVVNAGIALYAPFAASARGLNPAFWVVKCFLFGGVALNELTSIAEKKKQQP